MTTVDVYLRAEDIADAAACDHELARELEDALHQDVMRAVAGGEVDAAQLAKAARLALGDPR